MNRISFKHPILVGLSIVPPIYVDNPRDLSHNAGIPSHQTVILSHTPHTAVHRPDSLIFFGPVSH